MKVKLFLRDIDAEYPLSVIAQGIVSESEIHYGQSPYWAGRWAGEYHHSGSLSSHRNENVNDSYPPSDDEILSRVRRWRIRKEKFGGLFFDPTTRVVLKADKEAYRVALALRSSKEKYLPDQTVSDFLRTTRSAYDG